jgi:hypothetical protein
MKLRIENQSEVAQFRMPKSNFKNDNHFVHIFYCCIDQLKYRNNKPYLPLNANVRIPSANTKATIQMKKTLKESDEASKFWSYNGGVIIIAKSIKKIKVGKKDAVEIEIPQEYGVLNGGHTMWSINEAFRMGDFPKNYKNVLVRLEIIVGEFEKEEIADIAQARNTVENIQQYALANKKGHFDELKRELTPGLIDRIIWKPGEKDDDSAFNAEKLVWMMMLLETTIHPEGKPPISKSTGPGKVFANWNQHINDFSYLNKVLIHGLTLSETIYSSLLEENDKQTKDLTKKKFNSNPIFRKVKVGKETPLFKKQIHYKIDEGIWIPIYASFRILIEIDQQNRKVRWKNDPLEIWNDLNFRKALISHILAVVKQSKQILDIRKNSMYWTGIESLIKLNCPGKKPTDWCKY